MNGKKGATIFVALLAAFAAAIILLPDAHSENQTSQPDLIVSSVTFSNPNPGAASYETISATITNIGSGAAGGSTVDIEGNWNKWRMGLNSLSPGQSQTVSVNTWLNEGGYYFNVEADSFKQNAESNEENNVQLVRIKAGSASQRGNMHIEADAQSDVYIDQAMVGRTPIDVPDLSIGYHLVRLSSPGRQDSMTAEYVNSGSTTSISKDLPTQLQTGFPDLAITDIAAMPYNAGVPISYTDYSASSGFHVMLLNRGNSTAYSPVSTDINVSTINTRIGVGLIENGLPTDALLPGMAYNMIVTPVVSDGTYEVSASADALSRVSESDENNNNLKKTVQLVMRPTASQQQGCPPNCNNIVVDNLSIEPTENAGILSVIVRAKNTGTSPSPPANLTLKDGGWDGSYTVNSWSVQIPSMSPGETQSSTFNVKVGTGQHMFVASIGTSTKKRLLTVQNQEPLENTLIEFRSNVDEARVKIDYYNWGLTPLSVHGFSPGTHVLTVSKQGYDFINKPITIAQGKTVIDIPLTMHTPGPNDAPDIVAIVEPKQKTYSVPNPGGTTTLRFHEVVMNIGTANAGQSTAWVHFDGVRDALGGTYIYPLAPGESWDMGVDARIGGTGTHTLKVIADDQSSVTESNEANNAAETSVQVSVGNQTAGIGPLFVGSQPSAADVYLDNAYIGETPVNLMYAKTGPRTVRVSKAGYNDNISTLYVMEDPTFFVANLNIKYGECGDGKCDSGETISNCFIDCKTSSNGSSCPGIAPFPTQANTTQPTNIMETLPEDFGTSKMFYSTESNISTAFEGYIVQFDEQPISAVESVINADISVKETRAKMLRKEIEGVDTKGLAIITGTIRKYNLNKRLNELETDLNSTKLNRPTSITQHKSRIKNEHTNFRQNIKRLIINGEEKIKEEYDTAFNGALLNVSEGEIETIKSQPGVKKIYPNNIITIDLLTSTAYIEADSVWKLNDSSGNKITGLGRTIAIVDTGIDYTHPDLGGCFGPQCKVKAGYDFQNNDPDPMDDHGHGTHVAATAAGKGALKGVAPDADIYAYKVCSSGGQCSYSNIIAAINKALDPNGDGNLSDRADVISISLGGSGTPDDPASQAVDNAFNNGVFVSVAAGNSGPNPQTIACPGCARKAMTVAAWCRPENIGTNGYCSNPIASFSSRGPFVWSGGSIDKPDISAPGINICAAEWDSAWSGSRCIDNIHVSISGTSMATPHIAGAAALIKQAHPSWGPQQIKDSMIKTAVDQGIDKYSQGAGLVNVLAAITQSDTFPTSYIDISGKVTGIIDVNGTAFASNFTDYTLEYAPGNNPQTWATIIQSSMPVINGKLGSWNTLGLVEGSYTLRLTVRNSLGEANNKTRNVEVNNVFITTPSAQDIISGQDDLEIKGTVIGNSFENYKIEYGSGTAPISWSTNGIILANNGLNQKSNELLATWNTNTAQTEGVYTLRLTVQYSGGRTTSKTATAYVDPSLHKGWPKQLEPCAPGWCPTVILNPTVADINNDGKFEILTGIARYNSEGYPVSYRHVFNSDGTVAPGWPIQSSDHLNNGFVVTDVNDDGTNELIINDGNTGKIYTYDGKVTGTFYMPSNACIVAADIDPAFSGKEIIYNAGKQIVILHNDGTTYRNIPIGTLNMGSCPSAGDVNNDGSPEILTTGYSEIYMFDRYGNPVSGWPRDTGERLSSSYNSPVLADLDSDGKLEILMGGNNGTLSAFLHDGKPVSTFPIRIEVGYGLSDPAISDIDGDGANEIIIRSGKKIYVLENNGVTSPGWPQSMTDYSSLVNPIVGDIDGDSDKEIIAGKYAWHHNGIPVFGFPKKIDDVSLGTSSSPALGDVDGDGELELIIGPTQFKHNIYVYDTSGKPETVAGSMVKHDTMHTGNYNLATWQSPASSEKYYYYTLTNSECTINLTLNSIYGNQTLSARYTPNACDNSWDENRTASKGQRISLIRDGLNQGSYAIHVTSKGSYSLEKKAFCLKDTTKPSISVSQVPSQIKGDFQFTATVSDENGLKTCESCASIDGICDTEWTTLRTFGSGETQGTCTFTFQGSELPDNQYTLNLRVEDTGSNRAEGVPKKTTLDRKGPNMDSIIIGSGPETNSIINIAAKITDLSAITNVTSSLAGASVLMNINNISGLYQGILSTPARAGNYNLSITSTDISGNIAINSTTIFVSQPVNWSAAVRIISPKRNATDPQISREQTTGNFAVVWEDSSDGSPDIYYSRISPSAQILAFSNKLTSTVYNSKKPHAFSETEKIHIAWQDDRDGNNEIYYSQIINDQAVISNRRITFNLFESTNPKVASDGTFVHVFWIDNREGINSIYHTQLDNYGNKVSGDARIVDDVTDYAVTSSLLDMEIRIAWISGGKAYHGMISAGNLENSILIGDARRVALVAAAESYVASASDSGITLSIINTSSVSKSVAIAPSGDNPSISFGQNGSVILVWNDPDAMYEMLDTSGNILATSRKLSPGFKGKIAGGIELMAILEQAGELSITSTARLEGTAPVIQLEADEIQRQTGMVTIKTNEPSHATISYTQSKTALNTTTQELNYTHTLIMENLQPATYYDIQAYAVDAAGNMRTASTNLTTQTQANKPALPTTFYGTVTEKSGALLGGINVIAYWTDTDKINRTTSATTIASGYLLGYYLFNKANVNAKEGSSIRISAPDAVQEATILAQPGSMPINITLPVIVDKTHPIAQIATPQNGATYPSPFLTLNFTVNEPVIRSEFVLNSNSPVIVTGKEGEAINVTAKIGQNKLTITVTDIIGLKGQAETNFLVEDKVPPIVRANLIAHARNVTELSANISDSTNSLSYCEVCAGNPCSWLKAQHNFGPGSMQGNCIYKWNTTNVPDGLHPISFRATDEAGNTGISDQITIKIDNTKPQPLPLTVEPLAKQNKISIRWMQSSESEFKQYVVYRSSSPAQAIAIITNISQTQFVDGNVESGKTYSYSTVVIDEAGNEADPIFQQATAADTIPPNITILLPEKKIYNTTSVPLYFATNEETTWCGYRLNNKPISVVNGATTINADEGNNSLILLCNDTSQNQGNSSLTFSVDSTPPQPINIAVSGVPKKSQLLITWTKSPESGFERYNIYRSNTPFQSTTSASRIATILDQNTVQFTDFTVISQQTYHYAVTATDMVGNENTSVISTQGTVSDTIQPSITILSPKNQIHKNATIPLQYSANEQLIWCGYTLNGNSKIQISGNTTIIGPEGINTITLYCNDTSQNQAAATASFDIDAEIPSNSITIVNSEKGKNSLRLNITPGKSRDFSRFNIYRSQTPFTSISNAEKVASTGLTQHEDAGLLSETTYYYSVTAVDAYGNENTSVLLASGTVADVNPPGPLTTTATTAYKALSVHVKWGKSNAPDFSNYSIYRSTSPFTSTTQASKIATTNNADELEFTDTDVASDTTYFYAVVARDNSGNENISVQSASARTYDFSPPSVTISQPQNKTYTSDQITLSVSVDEPANCTYTVNSDTQQPITATARITAEEGGNTINVSCNDTNQNIGSAAITFSKDSVAPQQIVIINISPAKSQNKITITWQPISSTDLSNYSIYRSTSPFTSTTQAIMIGTVASSATAYVDNTAQSETTYHYAVTATDIHGNENNTVSSKEGTSADTIAPSQSTGLDIIQVPRQAELKIKWQANPEKDISHYSVYRSNSSFDKAQPAFLIANTSTNEYDDKGLKSETTYHYAITAVDNSSNENKNVITASGTTSDITPPNITITSPVQKAYNTLTIPLQYHVSEAATCAYSLNGATNEAITPFINATEGQNSITLSCQDGAGNPGNESISFSVDTTPPRQEKLTALQIPRKEAVMLNWTQSSAEDFGEYSIYKSQQNFSSTNDPAVSAISTTKQKTQTSYTDDLVKSQQTYYYAAIISDTAGNANRTIQTISVTIEDLTPPNIIITHPQNGRKYNNTAIPLNYSANEPITKCSQDIDNKISPIIDNNTVITAKEGTNNLKISCEDLNSNTGNATVNFEVDTQAPPPILSLTAKWGQGGLQLAWQQSPATDLNYYAIYRSNTYFEDSRTAQRIRTTSETSYIDANIESEKTFYYAVTAVDLYNNENSIVTPANATIPDLKAPAPIQNITVYTLKNQTSLKITWQPSIEEDFSNYTLYRSTSPFSTATPDLRIATIQKRESSNYTDAGLEGGKTYYYAVTATDKTGNENIKVTAESGIPADMTPPTVFVQQIQNPIYGTVVLRATVSDNSLSQSCEICITEIQSSSSCLWQAATNGFAETAKNGSCTYTWSTPNDGAAHYYTFRVKDTSDNLAEGELKQANTMNLNEEVSYTIQLYQGWNLISFPVMPHKNDIKSVMQPISGKYTRMFNYDGLSNTWKSHFAEEKLFNPEETLNTIEPGKGYWIDVIEDTTLTIAGTRVPSLTTQLKKDWNMIGYPYEIQSSPETALSNLGSRYYALFSYNAIDKRWERYSPYPSITNPNTITALQPGTGYMIDMRQDATWDPQRP
ncbi:S8 family serine peptidase [Candidatus Woesearchaeota archaeon]|nr:S8 family serine peptidase [Candidatus Woesearchaeota archaeon]